MRFIRFYFFLSFISFISNDCLSQTQQTTALTIGDKFPDLTFTLHTGDQSHRASLHDFKGKLVIFDFWGLNCAPCIADMPKLLKLQEQYPDKLQIIIYTVNSTEDISLFWGRFRNYFPQSVYEAAQKLPFITSDSVLSKLVPHKSLGLHIWLDGQGIYRASQYDVPTAERVELFFSKDSVKTEQVVVPDLRNPRQWEEKRIGFSDKLLDFSILTKYDPGFGGVGSFYLHQFRRDSASNNIIGFSMINASVVDLYSMAYFQKFQSDWKVHFELKDPQSYFGPPEGSDNFGADEWRKTYLFCYVTEIQPGSSDDIFGLMRKNLDRIFKLHSSLQKVMIKCWILKRIGNVNKLKSKGVSTPGDIETIINDQNEKTLIIKNAPFLVLWQQVLQPYYTITSGPYAEPFFDETNYTGNIDLELPITKDHSITLLRAFLRRYGLDLVREYRKVDVIVIK